MGMQPESLKERLEAELLQLLSYRKTIAFVSILGLVFGLAAEGQLFQTMFVPSLGIAMTMFIVSLLYFIDYLARKNKRLKAECADLERRLENQQARANLSAKSKLMDAQQPDDSTPMRLVR